MADTQRLPAPLTDNWDWQTFAACRGMDIPVFFHPPDERNAARERRVAEAKPFVTGAPLSSRAGNTRSKPVNPTESGADSPNTNARPFWECTP